MFCSFRPALESLERREVFNAGPLDAALLTAGEPPAMESINFGAIELKDANRGAYHILPYIEQDNVYKLASSSTSDGVLGGEVTQSQIIAILIGLLRDPSGVYMEEVSLNSRTLPSADGVILSASNLTAATSGRGIVGVFNGDALPDLASLSAGAVLDDGLNRAANASVGGQLSSWILPYLEQDNVYKLSQPSAGTASDDNAFLDAVYRDLVSRQATAHDALFAQIGLQETDRLTAEPALERNLIGGLLIPFMQKPNQATAVDQASRDVVYAEASVTDGTSNTLMFG